MKNSEFIEHHQITTDYLWNDGIHLLGTGKSLLSQNVIIGSVDSYAKMIIFSTFFNGSSLPGDHTIEI